jgi:hypothetical protein
MGTTAAAEFWMRGGSGRVAGAIVLVMLILELPRSAFSCAGCNSNQLEASWRRNLFLLLQTVRPLPNAEQLTDCGISSNTWTP